MTLALLALVSGCRPADELDGVRRSGLRIGYAVEAPYAYVDGDRVTGHAPELARLIADELRIGRVEWVQTRFGTLLDELEQRRFDVVAAGLFVTPERAARAAFSEPNCEVGAGLLVARGEAQELRSLGAVVASPRARLAVLAGSVEERIASTAGLAAPRLVTVSSARVGLEAVRDDQADALALSMPTLRWLVAHGPQGALEAVEDTDPRRDAARSLIAYAFHRDAVALRDAWDAAQRKVLRTSQALDVDRRFGFDCGAHRGPTP